MYQVKVFLIIHYSRLISLEHDSSNLLLFCLKQESIKAFQKGF